MTLRTTLLFSTLALALGLGSCKKEKLPDLPEENSPYYSIRGLLDGDSIVWNVGEDNITLTYGTSDFNGIETYYGQINNNTSNQAVKIEVLRPEVFASSTGISGVQPGSIPLLVNQPGAIKLNFGVSYSQFNYVLVKDATNNFAPMNQISFDEYGVHDLTVKFTDYSSSESFTLPVKYGFENQLIKPGFTSSGIDDTLHVEAESVDGTHKWFLNNVLISEEPAFQKQVSDGIYKLRHVYTDIYNNTADYTTLIRFKEGHYYWQMKYYYLDQPSSTSHYGNVIISVKKNDVWYSSASAGENKNIALSTSNILTELNENFEPVNTMFDFSFGAVLSNPNLSDSLTLDSVTGRINIGFK